MCAWIAAAAMPDQADRIVKVQELRRLAGVYGVHKVRDTAGRQAVAGMVDATRAVEALSAADRAALAAAWGGYEATFGRTEQPQGKNAMRTSGAKHLAPPPLRQMGFVGVERVERRSMKVLGARAGLKF